MIDRVDERDTMFARAERRAGTPAYEDYYARRPELKEVDDRLRALPALCGPGGRHYEPSTCGEAEAFFCAIDDIVVDDGMVARWAPAVATGGGAALEALARSLGAVAAGCAPVDPALVYSHKGRFDDDYGREIRLPHGWAIVFLVEMDFDAMQAAPRAPVIRESARQYYRAAVVGKPIEAVLAKAGAGATCHYDAHYDVMLVPLAVAAGLGELGRHNLLIADRYGTRVRIGAVTTDFKLAPRARVSLGAARFCEICRKCSENCPSRALSDGPRVAVRGAWKWPTDAERCYGYWRAVGTDCGICMAVCPYSHRSNWFHNGVRWMLKRSPWLARVAAWGDDLVYGRRWRGRRQGPRNDHGRATERSRLAACDWRPAAGHAVTRSWGHQPQAASRPPVAIVLRSFRNRSVVVRHLTTSSTLNTLTGPSLSASIFSRTAWRSPPTPTA